LKKLKKGSMRSRKSPEKGGEKRENFWMGRSANGGRKFWEREGRTNQGTKGDQFHEAALQRAIKWFNGGIRTKKKEKRNEQTKKAYDVGQEGCARIGGEKKI